MTVGDNNTGERVKRCVLAYSGGLDSTVLLYKLIDEGYEVTPLAFDYGQTHVKELGAAHRICADLGIELIEAVLPDAPFRGSSLTEGEGVVVPNRNMVFLALAGALAESIGASEVAFAVQAGDYDTWPDCRPAFAEAMFTALQKATEGRVRLLYPFIRKTKLDIVKIGLRLSVPFDLTWSCYAGGDEPCGECPACLGRREALFLGRHG